jgi:hypothetical protein
LPADITVGEGGVEVNTSTVALMLAEQAATVSLDVDVATSVAALTLAAPSAGVVLNDNVPANAGALVLTEHPAAVTASVNVLAGVCVVTLTTFQVTFQPTVPANIDPRRTLYARDENRTIQDMGGENRTIRVLPAERTHRVLRS